MNASSSIGLNYKVVNAKGVESYIVSLVHLVDLETIRDPNYIALIQKCSRVYTESGPNVFVTSLQGNRADEKRPYQHIEFPYFYDVAIVQEAWRNRIPVFALDKEERWSANKSLIEQLGVDQFERMLMAGVEEISDKSSKPVWRDTSFYERVRKKTVPEKLQQREDHWCKTLIPELLNADKPIGIAVGIAHVVGEDGLAEQFRKAGLTVELMAPSKL